MFFSRVSVVRTTTVGPPGMGLWHPVKQVPPDPDLQAELYGYLEEYNFHHGRRGLFDRLKSSLLMLRFGL